MSDRLTIAGGTVAALVAAAASAGAGRDVDLYLPRKNVGGGFGPLRLDGRRLERGIRLLELRYEGVPDPPPLSAYSPYWGAHRPYTRLIEEYVSELVGGALVEVEPPLMFFRGRLSPELYLRSDLSGLASLLREEELQTVAHEARAALDDHGEAGVMTPHELWVETLTDASRTNHGPTFHDLLIEPIARKIRPEGADDCLAALRRKLWMPLFWPRSVWEAAAGEQLSFRPYRPMHTVAPGGTGEIVDRLLARIHANERIAVTAIDRIESVSQNGAVRLDLGEAGSVDAQRPILALAPGELFAAADIDFQADKVGSVLTWLEVAEDDVLSLPSMVHVTDPELALFRYTPGERDPAGGRRILCCELAHDVAKESAAGEARAGLERLGIVRDGCELTELASFSGPTWTAPTAANLERFESARDALLALELDAEITGGALAFGCDALNEQIVQGLVAAERAAAE